MNWNFLTVGLGHVSYEKAARRLLEEAQKSGYFHSSIMEDNYSFQKNHHTFIEEHGPFIYSEFHSKGFGNFIWKPYLLQHWLKRIPEGEGLCYLDAGCSFNFMNDKAKKRMSEYLRLAQDQGSLLTKLVNGQFGIENLAENRWTHPQLFELLNIQFKDQNSTQIQAGIVFLVNNAKNRLLLSEWLEIAVRDDYKYLKGASFQSPNGEILETRHDQSIFSCLAKKYGLYAIPDETYFYPNWKSLGRDFPIWAMRNRSGTNLVQFQIHDIFEYLIRFLHKIRRKFGL